MLTALLIGLGGLFYRIRGGLGNEWVRLRLGKHVGWEIPNVYIRLAWALFIALVIAHETGLWAFTPWITLAAFVGVLFGYFGGGFDLSLPENSSPRNYARLTLRGMFILFPAALLSLPFGVPDVWHGVMAGALFVPCYLAGNVVHRYFKQQGNTQWGEWLLGAVTTAGVVW